MVDIIYFQMAQDFVYLVTIMDWFSRQALARPTRRLSLQALNLGGGCTSEHGPLADISQIPAQAPEVQIQHTSKI
jgi:hypothetical protein